MLTGAFIDGKIFQNRRVSSPAPVTIVCSCSDKVKMNNFLSTKQTHYGTMLCGDIQYLTIRRHCKVQHSHAMAS